MSFNSLKTTLAGFIGGVAFIIGCGGGGGGSASNSAIANTTTQVQDIEEMYCRISRDGVSSWENIYSVNGHYLQSITSTYAEAYPNHIVYCATLSASGFTQYTLASLEQGGWKIYNDGSAKVWRAISR